MTNDHTHTNRLADETSPYLLQHAHNPVDWYPWGDEALEKARREDKPIFLSIGYSACHWCHVMERESFESERIARVLNEHFVSIKVDREERPDLDNIYMNAVQVMTGQGGWPMSVWLSPDLTPFYAGTYFPPESRYGRPGFMDVLGQLIDAWENDRDKIEDVGQRITERLASMEKPGKTSERLDRQPVEAAFGEMQRTFDGKHGGFGEAPKFPPSQQLRLLLHVWGDLNADEDQREEALAMVEVTLARMASGGMYDQLGGGFHRYSVDAKWLIPHFEKMLYDNALLADAYVEAWQATGRQFYRRIACETLDYVLREMIDTSREDKQPFYSTQDADTEGEEGKFFVWTPAELEAVLGVNDAQRAAEYWGVAPGGNFEHGQSALNRLHHLDKRGHEAAFDRVPGDIQAIRDKLFEAREQRTRPGTDTKILAAWNGMMIGAMAKAGFAFDEPKYVRAAERAADFVLDEMVEGDLKSDFGLMRTYKDGRARFPGYLDDFSWMAAALMDLFEATGDLHRLEQAESFVQRSVELFLDPAGGFFYTAEHHKNLIVRQKETYDGATPSGNSIAVMNLLRLAELRGRTDLRDLADEALRSLYAKMGRIPTGMSEMLQALDFHTEGPTEVVLIEPDGESEEMRDVLRKSYVPNMVRVMAGLDGRGLDDWAKAVPLVEAREAKDGKPTAYVCFERACQQPTTDVGELEGQLGG
ncbi:thioredoxin domain-containing protein [Persicimonas caeni]|uniref:Thioredoxin domain-containing protein n=1 Tax=Persicimonas caeni TaxID=2292766 RepID=A0A4Y6PUM4_PERCE|nr:thioredoxin domain-containing protein [Persicimonas caeni]QDG51809.1 thioredoxin domain-containing protein [Persicimonas caeni]QED33030.1 thioredoxin domain-containing protein [Persicimonas caeni]